jgi:hypothetical protein
MGKNALWDLSLGSQRTSGAPGATRTHNHRIRSPVLYPLELQGPAPVKSAGHATCLFAPARTDKSSLILYQKLGLGTGTNALIHPGAGKRAQDRLRLTTEALT